MSLCYVTPTKLNRISALIRFYENCELNNNWLILYKVFILTFNHPKHVSGSENLGQYYFSQDSHSTPDNMEILGFWGAYDNANQGKINR